MKKHVSFAAAAVFLAGCSMAPSFHVPSSPNPPAYKEEAAEGSWKTASPAAAAETRGEWWSVFNDETLNGLETQARAGNIDLQAAAARVTQARAGADATRSAMLPAIDLRAGESRTRINPGAQNLPAGTPAVSSYYNAKLGMAYELDLFGKNLNNRRAANSTALSAEARLQSAVLALQSDVAEVYFSIRMLDAERKLLEDTLKLREDSLGILNKRLEAGSITELDTAQSTVDLETTRSQLQSVVQSRRELEHSLAVLLGKAPAEFSLPPGQLAQAPPAIPAGLPSELLERRPDIAAAQYDLAAANARIGIARAAFFPDISLTATGGVESAGLGDLFKWSSRAWSWGPLLTLPIFHGGAWLAEKKRSQAAYDEAVAVYRGAVLTAFKDVEDSLSRLHTLQEQAESQKKAEAAAGRAEKLADIRYDNGDLGYLEAITARSSALAVRRAGLEIQGAGLGETVRLIRALGGGWKDQPADMKEGVTP